MIWLLYILAPISIVGNLVLCGVFLYREAKRFFGSWGYAYVPPEMQERAK